MKLPDAEENITVKNPRAFQQVKYKHIHSQGIVLARDFFVKKPTSLNRSMSLATGG